MGRGLDRAVTQHLADHLERGALPQEPRGGRVAEDMGSKRWGRDTGTAERLRGNLGDHRAGDGRPRGDGGEKDVRAVDRGARPLHRIQYGIADVLWQG
jgi:hypothetical protein